MTVLLVFIVLLFLILVPIPIKLMLYTSENCIYIKFYNILLFSSEKEAIISELIKKLFIKISSKSSNKATKKKNNNNPLTLNPFTKLFKNKKISIVTLYKNLTLNKLKPKFILRGNINFELEDAAITAITYGLASNLVPILNFALSKFFRVKDLSIHICPHFKGENILNLKLTSIISLNIAQIISISILIIKSFKIKKEVDPKSY